MQKKHFFAVQIMIFQSKINFDFFALGYLPSYYKKFSQNIFDLKGKKNALKRFETLKDALALGVLKCSNRSSFVKDGLDQR
jgi:hypothetical protein